MRKFLTTFAVFTSLTFASLVHAAESAPGAPAQAEAPAPAGEKAAKAERTLPFQGTVLRVDKASNSFVTKTKAGKEHTFQLTEKSTIVKNDAPATLDDIKEGDTVRGSRLKLGENQWQAVKVMIGAKPEKKAKKSAKAKVEESKEQE